MKKYQKPVAEIVELELEDVISSSEGGNANSASVGDEVQACFPINLPCHSQEGNQPAC